ncbi:uncharacterized protein [Palaemon carinicauda]|uniref:uncharacterized protein n=1 Tax=Palaemon carinicauda TaxID=392227 RepID=UPI0035B5C993
MESVTEPSVLSKVRLVKPTPKSEDLRIADIYRSPYYAAALYPGSSGSGDVPTSTAGMGMDTGVSLALASLMPPALPLLPHAAAAAAAAAALMPYHHHQVTPSYSNPGPSAHVRSLSPRPQPPNLAQRNPNHINCPPIRPRPARTTSFTVEELLKDKRPPSPRDISHNSSFPVIVSSLYGQRAPPPPPPPSEDCSDNHQQPSSTTPALSLQIPQESWTPPPLPQPPAPPTGISAPQNSSQRHHPHSVTDISQHHRHSPDSRNEDLASRASESEGPIQVCLDDSLPSSSAPSSPSVSPLPRYNSLPPSPALPLNSSKPYFPTRSSPSTRHRSQSPIRRSPSSTHDNSVSSQASSIFNIHSLSNKRPHQSSTSTPKRPFTPPSPMTSNECVRASSSSSNSSRYPVPIFTSNINSPSISLSQSSSPSSSTNSYPFPYTSIPVSSSSPSMMGRVKRLSETKIRILNPTAE